MKSDVKGRHEFKNIVMSPMSLNFGLMRSVCCMALGSPPQVAQVIFSTVIEHISMHMGFGTRIYFLQSVSNDVWLGNAEVEGDYGQGESC
jgi:hypothetical protein